MTERISPVTKPDSGAARTGIVNAASGHGTDEALVERVAIMAGNSRVAIGPDGVTVEGQLRAFEAAMAHAARHRAAFGETPSLSVAFDHHGVFRNGFLASCLTNGQKRNPRLSQLHPQIRQVFEPGATKWGIALDAILAIHEDSARSHLEHLLKTTTLPPAVRHRIVTMNAAEEKAGPTCAGGGNGEKLTCAAITREYFEKAASGPFPNHTLLEVYFEDAPWSQPLAYVRGLQMTHVLGSSLAIRLNLVSADGTVRRGEISTPARL